jgi:hypothetical protein
MHLILEPGAIIYFPIMPSVFARPVLKAILIISLVDISAYKCCLSLAMRHIIKQLTLIFVSEPVSVNDDPSDLDILFPFSRER